MINCQHCTPTRESDGAGGYYEFVTDDLNRVSLDIQFHGNNIEAICDSQNNIKIGDYIKITGIK